jgi:hypothetical protein
VVHASNLKFNPQYQIKINKPNNNSSSNNHNPRKLQVLMKVWKHWNLYPLLISNVKWYNAMENSMAVIQLKIKLLHDLAIPLQGRYPK